MWDHLMDTVIGHVHCDVLQKQMEAVCVRACEGCLVVGSGGEGGRREGVPGK
jgi:hypothetical protein